MNLNFGPLIDENDTNDEDDKNDCFDRLQFMKCDVTIGVKQQAGQDSERNGIYSLVNVNQGGILVNLMRYAMLSGHYEQLDAEIRRLVLPFLYNEGNGKLIPIAQLIRTRNLERAKGTPIIGDHDRSRSGRSFDPVRRVRNQCMRSNLLSRSFRQTNSNSSQNGANRRSYLKRGFREVCWRLDRRGYLGETVIHICILNGTQVHLQLVYRLIRLFPKLANDIYVNDEFYGESPLHMSIVNDQVDLVRFLLRNGANVHEQCVGRFFCPDDQKEMRLDVIDSEHFIMPKHTNYQGTLYWGEFPLSFAVSRESKECFKLILEHEANPDFQDTNGNSVLHMCVIHNKREMFDCAFKVGSDLHLKNRQKLTPLSLAAKLIRVEMFYHILNLQKDVYWHFCNEAFIAYPIEEIDSINVYTGQVYSESALSVVVFGEEPNHIDMLDGLLGELLLQKWDKFARHRFREQMCWYSIHFLFTFFAFLLRPIDMQIKTESNGLFAFITSDCLTKNYSTTTISHQSDVISSPSTLSVAPMLNFSGWLVNSCFLRNQWNNSENSWHKIAEMMTVVTSTMYIGVFILNLKRIGVDSFWETMRMEPGRAMFLFSCILIELCIPFRLLCLPSIEERLAAVAMFFTPMHMLYFFRGFKTVGPFVVMIYKMLISDLLCFVLIYLVFLVGYAQAFFIIFRSHSADSVNHFAGAGESVLSMFLMSLLEFGDVFEQFDHTDHPTLARLLFVSYSILVALMLMNMLIAMMGKTYQEIASRPNEWFRQWARIVLIVERALTNAERQRLQEAYTSVRDGRRVFLSTVQLNRSKEAETLQQAEQLKQANRRMRCAKIWPTSSCD